MTRLPSPAATATPCEPPPRPLPPSPHAARAVGYTWQSAAGGNWSKAANWVGGQVPVSAADTAGPSGPLRLRPGKLPPA